LAFIVFYSFISLYRRVGARTGYGLVDLPENSRALSDPFPHRTLHIIGSFLFLQWWRIWFLPSIGHIHQAHRAIRRVLVIAGMVSATDGLWMTLTTPSPETFRETCLWVKDVGSLMIGFIVLGRDRDQISKYLFQHSAAMLRAYAIGQVHLTTNQWIDLVMLS
jgi:hypothetical protein